jgi:hypothetical protein
MTSLPTMRPVEVRYRPEAIADLTDIIGSFAVSVPALLRRVVLSSGFGSDAAASEFCRMPVDRATICCLDCGPCHLSGGP